MPLDNQILQRLKNNDPTLTTLKLRDKEMGASAAKELAAMLKDNHFLHTLDLSNNEFGAAGAKDIVASLKDNCTLTTLHLGRNKIGTAGAKDLAAMLKDNYTLTTLDLYYNQISKAIEEEIKVLLARNKALAQQYFQAIVKGDLGQAKALQQQGVSIHAHATDDNGNTALHFAAREGNVALVQWLIESHYKDRAVLTQRNDYGETALGLSTSPAIDDYLKKASQLPLSTPLSIANAPVAKQTLPEFNQAPAVIKPPTPSSPSSNSNTPCTLFAPPVAKSATTLPPIDHPPQNTLIMLPVPKIPHNQIILGRQLGKGGFGLVFEATWQYNQIAVKTLLSEMLSEDALEELEHETTLMMQLHHPNIVRLYGVSMDEQPYYIVLELMTNGSLYSYLRKKVPAIPITTLLQHQIALDITKGLAFLHGQAKPIIHRDLKSQNVLLDQNLQAKLADFGLAKVKTETTATCSSAGGAGTHRWMGPELFKRGGKQNTKSDMFSYAMTLWELISRKLPFSEAPNPHQVTQWIIDGEREDIPADCPPLLAKLITTCWAQNPDDRLTAEQALAALVVDKQQGSNAQRLRC